MQVWLDHLEEVDLRLVVSSKSSAAGIAKARRRGIPVILGPIKNNWSELHRQLLLRKIDRVMLVGFMKLLPADFVQAWGGKIWNVHPSLLPSYPGLESFEKAFAEGAPLGITVHEVVAEMDAGPILWQKKVRRFEFLDETWLRGTLAEHDLMKRSLRQCR